MRKSLSLGLFLLTLFAVAPMLAACHTTAGVGQDVSATGRAVTKGAEKLTP